MGHKILLIEDECAIAESLAYSLASEGFEVLTVGDGAAGLSAARSSTPDLIILDLLLPQISGLDVCRTLRRECTTPIIILTAKNEEIDRIVGLELGADDYVTKPFSVRELIARIRALLRRTTSKQTDDCKMQVCVGKITVDLARRRVTVAETLVHLPLKQFELLRILIMNQDKVLTREFLLESVWDNDSHCDTGTLDVHIRWLREKIEEDAGRPQYIRTVRGVGYKFVGEKESNN